MIPRGPATQLQKSEVRFRLLVESVKDYVIFILTPKGHVETWNAGADVLSSAPVQALVGVTRILQKPVRLERLLSVVQEYCAQ